MVDSQIEEIKNKLNIIDIIGGYMKLTKTGINYRGVCPFHHEKTPSFFVSPTRQMWHCFGCGAGFSMFDFVMKIEGVEFGDALRILAGKAGIKLKRENVELRTERERLYEICELATLFFVRQLEGGIGKEAEEYLLHRGITKESIKKWRLGYSPDTWNSLTDFLIGKGYDRQEIVKTGLAIEKEEKQGESYDRFRGRIMFPVFDLNSQVVGFGGRVFKQVGEIAKYINSPQTLIYDKSRLLYGLHNAKVSIRKANQCVVTEGYTDVIMCHQVGFENTVAASGTALTTQHLHILKRYSENLVLAFDADFAGDTATKRGINLAQEQGFNIKIVGSYLKDADPADIVLRDPKMWENVVNQARSIMDYYFDSALASFDKNTPEGKKEIGKIVLPAIKLLQNKIEQAHWIQKLGETLGIKEEAITEELQKVKVEKVYQEEIPSKLQPSYGKSSGDDRKKLIEEKIIALILKNPDYVALISKDQYWLFSANVQQFLREVEKCIEENTSDEGELKKDLKAILGTSLSASELDNEFKNFLAALALRGEAEYAEDGEEEINLCILQLKNIELRNKLHTISEDIKKAEKEKDFKKVEMLVEEFSKLTKEL